MKDPVTEKIHRLASDLFDVPVNQIMPESTPATLENWDSVQQLNLMLALEDEFGIKFEPEDMESLQSIGQVAAAVHSKLGTSG